MGDLPSVIRGLHLPPKGSRIVIREGTEGKLSLFSSETSHPGFCKSK